MALFYDDCKWQQQQLRRWDTAAQVSGVGEPPLMTVAASRRPPYHVNPCETIQW